MKSLQTNSLENRYTLIKGIRSYAMVGALIVIWVLFAILTGGTFLSVRNLSNLFRLTGIKGILVIGMVGCLVSGEFDLSIGSVVGVTGAITALLQTQYDMNCVCAIAISLLAGLLIGVWQGYWIAYQNVPAFIVTLGGMMIFRGATVLVTKGCSIPVSNPDFALLGQEYLPGWLSILLGIICIGGFIFFEQGMRRRRSSYGFDIASKRVLFGKYFLVLVLVGCFVFGFNSYQGIPVPVLILLILYFIFAFLYNKTQYGRYIYAVGGNSKAAKLSGIDIRKVYMKVFVMMGFLSAVASNVLTSRLASATPNAGNSFEMDSIAACVIGGISLTGGRGMLFGALVGALVMTSLGNGMSLLNLTAAWQDVIKGLILLMAVWFDVSSNKQNR
ncbi:sugar ABC transporter permease [Sediminispirochaeta smaragdinae]|uniref:Xylose transport system permease protein XylH n=1 Tax=Sediminispirochaeta smaragdinae (strain DSM 11293 / JCM 15392 / SEBR 4228) TaxID=573413 RepID=E1R7K3_SEDSS|nr:sugar ABC transporter permease [Sediminispirochaeta smaragdinae]ADK82708.1 inner-membrane translocator [Sediminispirochaeta smaragdinae DSM 11293]